MVESFCCQSYLSLYFTENGILLLHHKVDLVVTLGGDGTVIWVCASVSVSFGIKFFQNSSV